MEANPLKQVVEKLAELVDVPPPPRNLRAGKAGGSRTLVMKIALAVGTLIVAAAGTWLVLNHPGRDGSPASPPFVVEHLRVRGQAVEPRVMEVRGADALVLVAPSLRATGTTQRPAAAIPLTWTAGGAGAPRLRP